MPQDTYSRRRFIETTLAASGFTQVAVRLSQAAQTAQTPPATGPAAGPVYDDQQHTSDLFKNTPRRHAFRAHTLDEFRQWQSSFRQRLRELLGIAAMEREVPFEHRAEQVERVAKDGYTQEKWYLWTEPGVPLPIWVLIPEKPAAGPHPLVLTPHGHNVPEIYLGVADGDADRKSIAEGQRDIAVQAVREGYLCIHPTARGFGETMRPEDRKSRKVHSCRTGLMHAILFGRTMIGYRVWDISRIIDWATRRFEIDSRRIAITGNSGGGTTSLFAPACDQRISVAVPSCYFCTFEASIGSIHHCECNYVPGLLREGEMYDVAGLIAPRWFRAIAGKDDAIFPIAAVHEAFHRLRNIYRVAQAEDHCSLYVGDGPHRYYSDGAWPFIRNAFAQLSKTG
ncbi:MAG TPA: alpha/beta hydrolase family protein [Phycisphaerae bacterium]|nr:alpha/beta hydrolase family protein [Phycisphaerae bacterium]HRR85041.1 alpha/beta hydrolase family protein [Phycisphaerae bacterium]